jgi:hypothetical protein
LQSVLRNREALRTETWSARDFASLTLGPN